jgi:hypothetical protein
MKKLLIIGVIALFICMGIQPAISYKVSFVMSDDTTPPIIEVTWELFKFDRKWYVKFNCTAYDNESGVDLLELYVDDKFITIIFPGPVPDNYRYIHEWSKTLKACIFKFVAYNSAGLSAFVEIDGSDIKSTKDCDCQSNGKTLLAEKLLNNIASRLDIKSIDDCGCSDGDDYPIVLCAILWYQMFFATLLFMKTGWDVPMKILNAIGIKYNCPHFG